MPETSLEKIAAAAVEKEEENERFRLFLQNNPPEETDRLAQRLNAEIEPQIDCTKCGNCCRTLMITVNDADCERLAPELQLSTPIFKEKYTEQGFSGNRIINQVPCHFLSGNVCTVYAHRFSDCRDFPGIDKPGFAGRSFAMLMHYGRCPIVYNVWEGLKKATGFC